MQHTWESRNLYHWKAGKGTKQLVPTAGIW